VKLPRATHLVILCRNRTEEARERMARLMQKLKLTVNQQKTRVCRVPAESFDFLGYTIGQCYRAKTGEAYIGTRPSKKRVIRLFGTISEMTCHQTRGRETEEVVGELNLVLKGWANYFRLGSVSKAYRAVDRHTRNRLRRWLCRKHKVKGSGTRRYPVEYLHETLGLTRLTRFHTTLPWATAS
jgi:RNA-directed DNA polymerase